MYPQQGLNQIRFIITFCLEGTSLFVASLKVLLRMLVILLSCLLIMSFRLGVWIRLSIFVREVFYVIGDVLIFVVFVVFIVFWIIQLSRCFCIFFIFDEVADGLKHLHYAPGNAWRHHPRIALVGKTWRLVFWADLSSLDLIYKDNNIILRIKEE